MARNRCRTKIAVLVSQPKCATARPLDRKTWRKNSIEKNSSEISCNDVPKARRTEFVYCMLFSRQPRNHIKAGATTARPKVISRADSVGRNSVAFDLIATLPISFSRRPIRERTTVSTSSVPRHTIHAKRCLPASDSSARPTCFNGKEGTRRPNAEAVATASPVEIAVVERTHKTCSAM